jgi:hypothetical protein
MTRITCTVDAEPVQRILGLLGVSAAHEVNETYETMQSALFVGPWLQRLR